MTKKISYAEMLKSKPLTNFFESQPYNPSDRIIDLETRRKAVLDLLSDGQKHKTSEISSPETGGTDGTRRLRELRAEGHNICKEKDAETDQWLYWLEKIEV